METAMIEAVKATVGTNGAPMAAQAVAPVADPDAVAAFQAAMDVPTATGVPFVSQVSEAWRTQQVTHQENLHRMTALTDMVKRGSISAGQVAEMQYDLMNISFHLEIVTSVAKKSSDAVSTLVKNG